MHPINPAASSNGSYDAEYAAQRYASGGSKNKLLNPSSWQM